MYLLVLHDRAIRCPGSHSWDLGNHEPSSRLPTEKRHALALPLFPRDRVTGLSDGDAVTAGCFALV